LIEALSIKLDHPFFLGQILKLPLVAATTIFYPHANYYPGGGFQDI
jgi:hypothetical protein